MNKTARFVAKIYQSINIDDPYQLSIENVAALFKMNSYYWNFSSEIVRHKGKYKVFINQRLNSQQQWQDFGHEMYHYFYDETNYGLLKESYAVYGESKADYFAYHFCVPTFMLWELRGVTVYDVMQLFNVEFDFALRRLEMYKNRLLMVAENKAKYVINR